MNTHAAGAVVSRFDSEAQKRVAAAFRTCPPEQFIRQLETHAPATLDEQVSFEKYYGWALYDAGEHQASRPHLLRALRWSRRGSPDRALLRGLLGHQGLSTGNLAQAERCVHRALADLPGVGNDAYLRAGHLHLLGRIHRRRGHLTQAIDTYRRALALMDERSPHWHATVSNLIFALLQNGQVHEANVLTRWSPLRAPTGGQEWSFATAVVSVALELGDVTRAERVLDRALEEHGDRCGERVRLVLLELRAAAFRARGRWAESEELLRTILDRSDLSTRNGDLVASSARGLAESLEGQGRFEEALAPARLAVHAGSLEDRAEWAGGLHVLGRCLAALGRGEDARRVFREALGVHERTQFEIERGRLEQSLERLGFADLLNGPREVRRDDAASTRLLRIELADGRTFLTLNRRLVEDIRAAAASDLPVLIEGETGTGKELVARLLHEQGPRAHAPFVVVDCATLSPDLADVELFGAARGAYTGAYRDRPGLVAQAEGGTLFLDELPELSHALQAKLLRLLQEGTYRRVGEDIGRSVRVRFIAATNRRVDGLLRNGALKPDLYYRLNGHRIALDPLRDRREEIGPLAEAFAQRCGLVLTSAAREALAACRWPGNARQLEMSLRVAAGRQPPGVPLDVADLVLPEKGSRMAVPDPDTLRAGRVAWERAALLRALRVNGGVVARAARSLGLTRQGFYLAMRRTGLSRRRNRIS